VSMKFTPSSTVRRSTAFACSRFSGSPQIPVPVMRIAPKPSRRTVRSPPTSIVPAASAVTFSCDMLITLAAAFGQCAGYGTLPDRHRQGMCPG